MTDLSSQLSCREESKSSSALATNRAERGMHTAYRTCSRSQGPVGMMRLQYSRATTPRVAHMGRTHWRYMGISTCTSLSHVLPSTQVNGIGAFSHERSFPGRLGSANTFCRQICRCSGRGAANGDWRWQSGVNSDGPGLSARHQRSPVL